MIRLVKGAYWDSEIKRAQVEGLEGYPVYTRKVYTDVSYIACARKLLSVPEVIYPQFATHNAHSLAAIYHLAGQNYYPGQYEFQCLHGMGEPLYEQVVGKVSEGKLNRPCRIYAPVGSHETLLAYLVRRLLENGANTSFVNRIADQSISLDELVEDPVIQVETMATHEGALGLSHPRIPLPRELYGNARLNSSGIDLSNEHRLGSLSSALLGSVNHVYTAAPTLGNETNHLRTVTTVRNPADHRDLVGQVYEANETDLQHAVLCARASGPIWQSTLPAERAAILERAADQVESEMQQLMGLLVRESGKTFANAIAEVREAVDFLRYYGAQARSFSNDSHRPLGPVVCISPWNFPLAIFSGQVAAALAAGNTVLAKPAEQTPLIAAQAVRILHQAGVPAGAVQLLPGRGETVGAGLVGSEWVRGVMFTGSTEVAGILSRNLAGRLNPQGQTLPLIAETGGMNAMIVDSSALAEQVVVDVISSAFDSAGQRCSALRVLCVQADVADHVSQMLRGAMAEHRVGSPERLNTDIGPVIDSEARDNIVKHIENMRSKGRNVFQAARAEGEEIQRGTFVLPTLIELESLDELEREVFGPVLHLVRYERHQLDQLLQQINASGYGLTLGVHTRIDETIAQVVDTACVGNLYVNRNIVGAVVGVQPFGGEGLSGTGPKAGGPLYLYRLLATRPQDAIKQAFAISEGQPVKVPVELEQARKAFATWAGQKEPTIAALFAQYLEQSRSYTTHLLNGPTGERNSYTLLPRGCVLNLAEERLDLLTQLAACLAVGSRALWLDSQQTLLAELPDEVSRYIDSLADWTGPDARFDAVLYHGDCDQLRKISEQVARRSGAIVGVHSLNRGETEIPLERLLIEHALSVNTAAAGGNANLMTIS
jgi:RHH-type proline utilization regulon transcriptional repressor/proline dehydrogenase/delta 1-pyrroline-5-carboxylate dehydrogenase